VQEQSDGEEEEEEEFTGLDRDDSRMIVPRELIRNLNMTQGGSIRNLNMAQGGSRVYVYSICHAFAMTCMLTFSHVRAIASDFLGLSSLPLSSSRVLPVQQHVWTPPCITGQQWVSCVNIPTPAAVTSFV